MLFEFGKGCVDEVFEGVRFYSVLRLPPLLGRVAIATLPTFLGADRLPEMAKAPI